MVTYCKDDLQVVKHVNLLGKSFATPSNQVVLTAPSMQKRGNLRLFVLEYFNTQPHLVSKTATAMNSVFKNKILFVSSSTYRKRWTKKIEMPSLSTAGESECLVQIKLDCLPLSSFASFGTLRESITEQPVWYTWGYYMRFDDMTSLDVLKKLKLKTFS